MWVIRTSPVGLPVGQGHARTQLTQSRRLGIVQNVLVKNITNTLSGKRESALTGGFGYGFGGTR
jgi:hypothetical protein